MNRLSLLLPWIGFFPRPACALRAPYPYLLVHENVSLTPDT